LTWNQIRCFHEQPGVIAAWRHLFGPALRWLTPGRRRFLLGIAAMFVGLRFLVRKLQKNEQRLDLIPDFINTALVVLLIAGFVWLCYLAAKRFARLPGFVRRHPQICLHSIFWILLGLLWTAQPSQGARRTVLIGCFIALPFLLWRIGYMLFAGQRGKMENTRFTDHLAYIFPLWGGGNTPYGKGWEYLSANEARDETDLAKSQLAGLKLFALAALWAIVKVLFDKVILGGNSVAGNRFSLGVPRLEEMLAEPAAYPIWLRWGALYLDLFRNVLGLAVKGHLVIGWLRLFGFNVFRNTYKPLLAESIVDFWNRYYYYFKELLLNFFFYPTFTRYFKALPRLRLFVAVFAAAFAGNVYYHWLGLEKELVTANFSGMWAALQSRVFYCALLALGISISMLRQQRARNIHARQPFRRAVAIFGVWTFYSIIHIWSQKDPALFMARFKFFLGLLGL
jgi:hypothetical protein